MEELHFRLAESGDAVSVLAIKRAAIRNLAGVTYTDGQIDAWAPNEDALGVFEAAIDHEQFTVLLAVAADGVAGYGVLNGPDERIDAVFIHPEHARAGIATSLVGQLEARARMRGIEKLTVVASLNATDFYASLGYWCFETLTRSIDGVDVEFAVMRKRLQ
jgi:GNAT superfamily N-acetyltransferase